MSSNDSISVPAGSDLRIQVKPAERLEMIAVAAYFRAERRGFAPGGAQQDWLLAEADIDRLLAGMRREGVTRRTYEGMGLRNALRIWAG